MRVNPFVKMIIAVLVALVVAKTLGLNSNNMHDPSYWTGFSLCAVFYLITLVELVYERNKNDR